METWDEHLAWDKVNGSYHFQHTISDNYTQHRINGGDRKKHNILWPPNIHCSHHHDHQRARWAFRNHLLKPIHTVCGWNTRRPHKTEGGLNWQYQKDILKIFMGPSLFHSFILPLFPLFSPTLTLWSLPFFHERLYLFTEIITCLNVLTLAQTLAS